MPTKHPGAKAKKNSGEENILFKMAAITIGCFLSNHKIVQFFKYLS